MAAGVGRRAQPGTRACPRATSPGGRSMPVCVLASIATSCISSTDALGPALCQQLGSEHRRFIALAMSNVGDQRVGCRIGDPVEVAFQRCGGCLGVEASGGDALVAEEAL